MFDVVDGETQRAAGHTLKGSVLAPSHLPLLCFSVPLLGASWVFFIILQLEVLIHVCAA